MLTRLTPWVAGLSLFLCGVVAWGQEDRLRNQRGLLEGIWTIDSIVQNGETLGADLIRAKVAEEGKLAFGTRMVTMIRPGSGQARTIAYRLDPSISPRGIDLFGEDDSLLQGIYRFDGDKVIFCLRDQKDGERPTEFASEYGDQTILMTLRVTLPETPKPAEPVAAAEPKPAPTPTPTPAPAPVAATPPPAEPATEPGLVPLTTTELAQSRDRAIGRMLVGTWTHSDTQGSITMLVRPDGTYASTRYWTDPLRKVFTGKTSTAGRWTVSNGTFSARVTKSTQADQLDQLYVAKLQSISDTTVIYHDLLGRELRMTRVP